MTGSENSAAGPLIRSAEDADRERLAAIMDATWQVIWAPSLPAHTDRFWRDNKVARMFVDQVWAFCLVATIDGAVAGFAHLSGDQVTSLHVDPAVKRRGVGRALMAAAEAQVRSLGFAQLRIESEVFNASAHAFYAALGYRETRRFVDDVVGQDVDCIEMTKTLG